METNGLADIEHSLKLAREYSLLNNYETALVLYKYLNTQLQNFAAAVRPTRKDLAEKAERLAKEAAAEAASVTSLVSELANFSTPPASGSDSRANATRGPRGAALNPRDMYNPFSTSDCRVPGPFRNP